MKTIFSYLLFISSFIISHNSFAERPASLESEVVAVTLDADPMYSANPPFEDKSSTQHSPEEDGLQHSQGDVLYIPTNQQSNIRIRQLDFPRRGMLQDRVQNELGRPIEKAPAVGMPPISRWVYNDRIVYFEFNSVIHVVAK